MKQRYSYLLGIYKKLSVLILAFSFTSGLFAQTYVNGNIGTGATSNNGTAAPAGATWHELQHNTPTESNSLLGTAHAATAGGNFTIADDFTVPAGQTWSISTLRIYSLDQVTTGTTSPYNNIRVRIWSGVPGAGGTIVYGDLTTNRFAATAYTNMRAIFNSLVPTPGAPTPNLPIFSIDANVNTVLSAGTYWVEWQVVNPNNNFSLTSQTVGVRTMPGYNARQSNAGVWVALVDGGSPASAPDVAVDVPFTINYVIAGACTGTPAPGNTIASSASVCPGLPYSLSLQNNPAVSGLTYQWQSGPSATGPWTNIAGATGSTYSTTMTTGAFYQAIVTCGTASATSTPVEVAVAPTSACYCTAGATSTLFEKISRVQIGTINRASTSTAGYENFITDTTNLQRQNPTPITVTLSGGFGSDVVFVWIDLNKDGDFSDAGELVYQSAPGAGPHTGTVTIPASAPLGYTRMRVRMHDASFGGNATPCGTSTYGQVEDYTVNITPCIPVAVTNQPVSASVQCGANATFTINATGTGLTYLWQQRTSATAPWTNLTNGGAYSGATSNALTISGSTAAMTGYQYRVLYTGACTGTDFSNVVTLTVTPLIATVTPVSANKCAGAGQQFTITNIPGATTATFNSTAPFNVPDGNAAGVLNPITVSGIPAGANISEVRVTLNITHSYVGDLDINIIAPNNGNLNLVGGLNGGAGNNNTANFTNTVISSLGTVALSGAPAPRTGTFRADALAGYGPTGNVQTVTTWTALTSVPNGTWRLAIADFFNIDAGTVNSWSITIVYGAPGTGTFTPVTGLFTDAAFTIPYTGGPINTVYANPTVTTTYGLVVSTAICTSDTLRIPYTVNNPIVGTSTISDATACVGGTATFTASAPTSGNVIQHQWKVSTDNGVTFTNVTNGGAYSGATTATLTVSGVTIAMDNYIYKDSLFVTPCTSSIVTNNATLNVNPNPVIVVSANPFTNLFPGLTTTLSAAVSPNPGATYTWFNNGVAVPGATGNTLVVDVDNLGSYTVTVSDVNGCTRTSNAIAIGDSISSVVFIYPSPNTGQFQVRYNEGMTSATSRVPWVLNVFDSKGARVYSRSYNVSTPYERMDVDLRSRGKGIYMVELTDRTGKRIKAGRVVIL